MKRENWQVHIVFFSAVGALFSVFFGMNAVKVALPTFHSQFGVDPSTLAWVSVGYSLTYASVLPVTGRLGDAYGRPRMILLGTFVFAAGALLCALAPSFAYLVAGRLISGMGGGMIFPNVMVLCTGLYPAGMRGRIVGVLASVASITGVMGPGLGGLLIAALGWRSLFYITVMLNVLAVLGISRAGRLVGQGAPESSRRPQVNVSTSLALLAVITFLLISVQNVEQLLRWPYLLAPVGFAASAVLLNAWDRRQGRQLLNFSLLKSPAVRHGTWSGVVQRSLVQVESLVLPLFLATRFGLTEAALGGVLLISAAVRVFMAPTGGWFSDRFGRGASLRIGFAAAAVTYGVMAYASTTGSLVLVIAALVFFAVGGAAISPTAWSLVLEGTPGDRQGMVSGLYDTVRQVSATLAVVVVSLGLDLGEGAAASFRVVYLGLMAVAILACASSLRLPRSFAAKAAPAAGEAD